uniref:Multiple coagulation factor deficiency protein 2 homolog n=1 Tax=Dermatophagoides pteronyssinus TaxID=6956 RepID=A0A6P6YDQ4_DERPT|nr:multiple coagulation factor deficiency protein 2 homolog [Dermatophagoides pteronyssinus]
MTTTTTKFGLKNKTILRMHRKPPTTTFLATILIVLVSFVYSESNVDVDDGRSILFDKNIEHIRHDFKEQFHFDIGDDGDGDKQQQQPNEDDMIFYNFRLHDYDNNLQLDGLEILASIYHESESTLTNDVKQKMTNNEIHSYWQEKFDRDADKIDQVFKIFDLNNDGFISYGEYLYSFKK